MDLKSYKGHTLLHLMYHSTRLSASSVIPKKKNRNYHPKIWISVYGPAEKLISDNHGEFASKDFMDMCETLGIIVKTNAAESPWSNCLVERQNLVLSERLDKITDETDCDISLAVYWCINAKNSLDKNLSRQYHVNDLSVKLNRASAPLSKMRKYVSCKNIKINLFCYF